MAEKTMYMMRITLFYILFIMIVSCVQEDGGRKNRPIITPFSSTTSTTPTTATTATTATTFRPDGEVFFSGTACGCLNKKPTTYGNCASVCAGKTDTNQELIYLNFTVGENILLTDLKNTKGWCTTNIIDPNTNTAIDGGNPGCILEAKELTKNITLNLEAGAGKFTGNNAIKTDISALRTQGQADSVWVLTLIENSSGARSNSIQVRIIETTATDVSSIKGPLKIAMANQYKCLKRGYSQDTNNYVYFDSSYELNFYFIDKYSPLPIPVNEYGVVCHDAGTYAVDKAEYPRLDLNEGVFRVWDMTDPRFYDNDSLDGIDIGQVIKKKIEEMGQTVSSTPNIFFLFNWPNGPTITGGSSSTSNAPPLGYIMSPWINKSTYLSYCPGNYEYNNSDNAIFLALKDIIGVETEGIYLALRESIIIQDNEGKTSKADDNFVILRESLLKQIWFYIEKGHKYIPSETTVANKTIQFYWPANTASPYVQQGVQKLYTVYHPKELTAGPGTSVNTGVGAYPPHDRKFGCIPKTQ